MIEAAEREGKAEARHSLIVEATAGNTGLGLALVASQKGYRLLIVVPDKMSQEKIFHLKAMGAEVVHDALGRRQRSSRVLPGPRRAPRHARRELVLRQPVRQRGQSASRTREHRPGDLGADGAQGRRGRRRRRHRRDDHRAARYFAKVSPQIEIVLADPVGSIVAEYVYTGKIRQGRVPGWSKASARISFRRCATSRA